MTTKTPPKPSAQASQALADAVRMILAVVPEPERPDLIAAVETLAISAPLRRLVNVMRHESASTADALARIYETQQQSWRQFLPDRPPRLRLIRADLPPA